MTEKAIKNTTKSRKLPPDKKRVHQIVIKIGESEMQEYQDYCYSNDTTVAVEMRQSLRRFIQEDDGSTIIDSVVVPPSENTIFYTLHLSDIEKEYFLGYAIERGTSITDLTIVALRQYLAMKTSEIVVAPKLETTSVIARDAWFAHLLEFKKQHKEIVRATKLKPTIPEEICNRFLDLCATKPSGELPKLLGISVSLLSYLRSKKRKPSRALLERAVTVFEVDPEWFWMENNKPEQVESLLNTTTTTKDILDIINALKVRLAIFDMVTCGCELQEILEKVGCSASVVKSTVLSWGTWKEDPDRPEDFANATKQYTKT